MGLRICDQKLNQRKLSGAPYPVALNGCLRGGFVPLGEKGGVFAVLVTRSCCWHFQLADARGCPFYMKPRLTIPELQ